MKRLAFSVCLLLVPALGCGDESATIAEIRAALEKPNGGLDFSDGLPALGQAELAQMDPSLVDAMDLIEPGMQLLSGSGATGSKCPNGILKGHWFRLHQEEPFGLFLGTWMSKVTPTGGLVLGFWGKNKAGKQVFFGKAVNYQGKFVALLSGTYDKSDFSGKWFNKSNKGRLGGKVLKNVFLGKWAKSCPPKFIKACHPAKVLSYKVGTTGSGGAVSAVRQDASKSLGMPEHNWGLAKPVDNTVNFTSLGKGGAMVLDWGGPVKAKQLWVIETSWGDHNQAGWNCARYPEKVEAYVSKDGKSWTFLGTGCRDSAFKLSGWFRYTKLMDVSDYGKSYMGDGYDVDGLDVCGGQKGHTYLSTYGQATPVP